MKPLALFLGILFLSACAIPEPKPATEREVAALAKAIHSLSPGIDRVEANQAAEIAFSYSRRLSDIYQITDPPLIHNAKVNAGLRPRGLCYHWAEDMERRLNAEGFSTLDMTRAIANARSRFLIEHSTAVITAKGAPMHSGLVLDPWRQGGTLFWSPVEADRRYTWIPRAQALRAKGQIRYAQRSAASVVPLPADLTD